jgi:hypothetical protein
MNGGSAATQVREWKIDAGNMMPIAMLGLLVTLAGLAGFGALAWWLRPPVRFSMVVPPDQVVPAVLKLVGACLGIVMLFAPLLLLHEACHGLAFRLVGAHPRYGAKMVATHLPVLYTTAPGEWLTRNQYMVVGAAPTVLIHLAGVLLMLPPAPLRWLLVVPLALHLGGCVGDWWVLTALARLPAATLIEDSQEGFRYRPG